MIRISLTSGDTLLTNTLVVASRGGADVLIHDNGVIAVADVVAIELLNGEQ